ncbi:unnamed protein product [Peniophora sp. CBMAI 1063]|nr:unnamed protein product [Peniophora sp. CBMAI 1063]
MATAQQCRRSVLQGRQQHAIPAPTPMPSAMPSMLFDFGLDSEALAALSKMSPEQIRALGPAVGLPTASSLARNSVVAPLSLFKSASPNASDARRVPSKRLRGEDEPDALALKREKKKKCNQNRPTLGKVEEEEGEEKCELLSRARELFFVWVLCDAGYPSRMERKDYTSKAYTDAASLLGLSTVDYPPSDDDTRMLTNHESEVRSSIRRAINTCDVEATYGIISNPATPADIEHNQARVLYLIGPEVELNVLPNVPVDIPAQHFHFKVCLHSVLKFVAL